MRENELLFEGAPSWNSTKLELHLFSKEFVEAFVKSVPGKSWGVGILLLLRALIFFLDLGA